MALPALSRAYSTRRNCLLPDRSTADAITRSAIWSLKAHLMDQVSTGTAGPTSRDPASVWTCLGSSDGVAGGLDAVDRWGSTFDASKLVWGTHGVSHSWIALENSALGLQLVLDLQPAVGQFVFAFTPISAPFSGGAGGTVSSRPNRLTSEVDWAYTTTATNNWFSGWVADTTLVVNQRSQFVCCADGSFFFFLTRDGLGVAPTCVGIVNPQSSSYFAKRGGDTNAHCFFGNAVGSASTPGAFGFSSWSAQAMHQRRQPNSALMNTGGMFAGNFGGVAFANASLSSDPFTGDFSALPIAFHAVTTQGFPYGVLPDFYVHGNRSLIPVGEPNDPGGVITHIAIGDLWVPWDGPVPSF